MFDTKRLFDQFVCDPNAGDPRNGPNNHDNPLNALTGGLGNLGNGFGGGLAGILGGIGQQMNGFGGGAAVGGLAGLLLGSKGGRKIAGTALQLGGMAVVGALAHRAYQNWQAGKSAAQSQHEAAQPAMLMPPSGEPFVSQAFLPEGSDETSLARNLLRAMIAAAKSDGHIDAEEQTAIFAEMDKLPLSSEDKAFVMDELRKPLDVDAVARGAHSAEEAANIYTASLLCIDIDNPAERGYLAMLAARLKLDDALVKHLHATVEGATVPAAA